MASAFLEFSRQDKAWKLEKVQKVRQITCSSGTAWVYGEIQHQWAFDENCVAHNLDSFFEKNDGFEKLDGHFTIVFLSKDLQHLKLIASRSGGFRLHLVARENSIKISSKMRELVAAPEFNLHGLSETFEYRWRSGNHSLYNNVYQVPCGHEIIIKPSGRFTTNRYFDFPSDNLEKGRTFEEHVSAVENLLSTTLINATPKKASVAILLSGGVDSSILAAISKKAYGSIVAFSHVSQDHKNPELDTAIRFAKELGIEHRLIEVNDDQINDAFVEATKICQQPLRYQSSVILYKLFEAMAQEFTHVIYGEAADTYFGNNMLKRHSVRKVKQNMLRRKLDVLPGRSLFLKVLPAKVKELYHENLQSLVEREVRISYSPEFQTFLNSQYGVSPKIFKDLSLLSDDKAALKHYLTVTDIENHFYETGALAENFGITLISPFSFWDVILESITLKDEFYYGGKYVKPVLRKIGEKYFTPELMYLPKQGFPAPYKQWLNNSLNSEVERGMDKFDIVEISDTDYECRWTLAGFGALD